MGRGRGREMTKDLKNYISYYSFYINHLIQTIDRAKTQEENLKDFGIVKNMTSVGSRISK